MNKLFQSAILIISLSNCREDIDVVPEQLKNEVCYEGKCITFREGTVTVLSNKSTSIATAFQVDLTDGYNSDLISMVLYSASTMELIPGKYDWKDYNLHEPNSINYALTVDKTAIPAHIFYGSISYEYHSCQGGSVTISKDGRNTIFEISLISDDKPLTGYFHGMLSSK